jgi:hypothetical protein
MGARRKLRVEQVAEALRNAGGIFSGAAQQLNCAPNTIANYVRASASLRDLLEELQEQHLDLAETKLIKLILDGDKTAIIFYLKTKGKSRGYSDRTEVTGANGAPLTTDVKELSDEELERIISGRPGGGSARSRRR